MFPLLTNKLSVVNPLASVYMAWIMTTTSATEHEDVTIDAWQVIVAAFDAQIADGKKTLPKNLLYKVCKCSI